jgi:hypothetical protein
MWACEHGLLVRALIWQMICVPLSCRRVGINQCEPASSKRELHSSVRKPTATHVASASARYVTHGYFSTGFVFDHCARRAPHGRTS